MSNLSYQRLLYSLIISICLLSPAQARDNTFGRGSVIFNAQGMDIKVFTYRPENCQNPSVLFIFHGIKRDAEKYRNKGIKLANKSCLMLFAPRFDKKRFRNWRYQRAGIWRKNKVQPSEKWTIHIVRDLIRLAKKEVKSPDPRVYLFGHSAGGQFLSRNIAYTPALGNDVDRILVSNPSAHVSPRLDEIPPFGYSGIFSEFEAYATMKAYLAAPITIYLGQEDTGDKYLVQKPAAKRQGKNRYERGRNVFAYAQAFAKKKGWTFNWIKVEVPRVGHNARKMLNASQFADALNEAVAMPKSAVGQ